MTIPLMLLCLSFILPPFAFSSSTNLPAPSTWGVYADTNGVVVTPTNWAEANAIARCLTQVVTLTNDCSGPWYDNGAGGFTNIQGWVTSGRTNGAGALLLAETQTVTSALSPRGYAAHTNTRSGGITLAVDMSADGSSWATAAATGSPVYIRWTASVGPSLPGATNTMTVDDFTIWGWANTAQVGRVQDFAGLTLRADPPADTRGIATAGYVQDQIAAISLTGGGSNWAAYPAIAAVNLAGQTVSLDTRYVLATSNDTLSLSYGGTPVWEVYGGGTVTPRIAYFGVTGTTLVMRVVASVDYRPYPEWSTNLVDWTRYATNEFASTWPALTNGQATLTFGAIDTTNVLYYRSVAVQTSTNGLSMAIRVPLRLDGEVTGGGMAGYATTQSVAAAAAAAAGVAVADGLAALTNAPAVKIGLGTMYATTTGSVAIGFAAGSLTGSVAIGKGASALGERSVAIGYEPLAAQAHAIALGSASAEGLCSLAVFDSAKALGDYSMAVGFSAMAASQFGMAIGDMALSTNAGAVAIGHAANAVATNAVQIGGGTNASPDTLQFRGYPLLQADGSIPGERLSVHSGSLFMPATGVMTNVVWIDLIAPGMTLAGGVAAPQLVDTGVGNGVKGMGYDLNDSAYGVLQMPHGLALTNATRPTLAIVPHVHWSFAAAPTPPDTNVTWELVWEWANINGGFDLIGTNTVTVGKLSATNSYLTGFGAITNNAAGISSLFRFRLGRISSVSNDYGATRILLDQFDIHVPIDRPGSAQETSQ